MGRVVGRLLNMNELHLTAKDFKIDWFSGTGKGGQHRNKHQNCCRITHIDTGLVGQGTESRERVANQRTAFNRLAEKVVNYYFPEKQIERFKASSGLVRVYHNVDNIVRDKKSGLTDTFINVVEKHGLDNMIVARKNETK